jgi:hypothetical protein
MTESLQRARQWLLAAQAKSAEERGMRLMGLVWTDAPRSRVQDAIREIRSQQEAGGGWSQFGRTEPDAYATGLSLYALRVAGVSTTDEGTQGRDAPASTQYQDGTRFVRPRLPGAAVFRVGSRTEDIMDLRCGHELGVARDRTNLPAAAGRRRAHRSGGSAARPSCPCRFEDGHDLRTAADAASTGVMTAWLKEALANRVTRIRVVSSAMRRATPQRLAVPLPRKRDGSSARTGVR